MTLPPALAGERFEFVGRAGALAGYMAGPVTAPGPGAAPPLLLVHSVNAAASAAEVRTLFDHARATRAVYALDLPGFGLSERSDRTYSPRLMTDALHDMLAFIRQRHGDGPIDALGVSLGCEFVARAAVEAPAHFRRLALVSPTGFRGKKPRHGPSGSVVGAPWILRLLEGPGRIWGAALFRGLTRPGVIRYFLNRTWGSRDIDEALWRYDVLSARQPGAHHAPLHFLAALLFSEDISTLYQQLQMPVWLSHGTRGDFTDYRGTSTVEGRPNWRFTVYQNCGALMYFERPAEFNSALDQHFA